MCREWRIVSLILFGMLAGCASSTHVATQVGAATLRSFANSVQHASPGSDGRVPKDTWPAALMAVSVKEVRYYIDGVLIVLYETERESRGLFVGWNDEAPHSGSGIGFERVDARVYRFTEKRRIAPNAARP